MPIVPPATPIYLGKAIVNDLGDFDLANTILSSTRFPANQHELVPRAYVDAYIASTVNYYNNIIFSGGINIFDRVSALEAQLERSYQALWAVSREAGSIVTPHSGSLTANYTMSNNVASAPDTPVSLTGFQ